MRGVPGSYAESIEAHYAKCWSPVIERGRLSTGPLHELPPGFEVLLFSHDDAAMAHATCCMSRADDDERLELHLLARPDAALRPQMIELLTVVAHYHRTGHRLGLGHTVNFGEPWLPGSECTRGLISLPYLDGEDLEWLVEPRVRFLWLIPVTDAEVSFKVQHGLEALEERFEQAAFDYLDPMRASVV